MKTRLTNVTKIKITCFLVATFSLLAPQQMYDSKSQASRSLASCDAEEVVQSLETQSRELEDQIDKMKDMIASTRASKPVVVPPLHAPVITESYYSMWKRQNPGMSQATALNYHQQVLQNRSHFARQLQSSSSFSFDEQGNLANSVYGYGPATSMHLQMMYRFPQMRLPSSTHLQAPITE